MSKACVIQPYSFLTYPFFFFFLLEILQDCLQRGSGLKDKVFSSLHFVFSLVFWITVRMLPTGKFSQKSENQ